MKLFQKMLWDIQRKSFSNKGIWKWLHQTAKSFDDIRRTLNER